MKRPMRCGVSKIEKERFVVRDRAFDHGDADDLVIGIDRSRDAFVRAIAVDSETGSEFSLVADDQYSVRQQKIGYYGSIEEGRVVLDDRAIVGVAIDL